MKTSQLFQRRNRPRQTPALAESERNRTATPGGEAAKTAPRHEVQEVEGSEADQKSRPGERRKRCAVEPHGDVSRGRQMDTAMRVCDESRGGRWALLGSNAPANSDFLRPRYARGTHRVSTVAYFDSSTQPSGASISCLGRSVVAGFECPNCFATVTGSSLNPIGEPPSSRWACEVRRVLEWPSRIVPT